MNNEPPTKCFCNGAVTSWHKVLSSFNACLPEGRFGFLEQAAASERYNRVNTNLVSKAVDDAVGRAG